MKRDKKNVDSSRIFDRLVRNALAFLERSAVELKDAPNYAVIDFCTAIELFLKARLLLEHWALVYEDPKLANLSKFREGDFKSVGMTDAIARLKNISGQSVSDQQKNVFEQIRRHRNMLVHFFHPAYGPNPDPTTVENVTAEQCRGWFFLNRLLSRTWQGHFAFYATELERIDGKMHENRSFLRVKYEARLKDIETGKANGTVFTACWFCGFEAMKAKAIGGPILLAECVVCETQVQCVPIQCTSCGANVPVSAPRAEPNCALCSKSITLSDLLDQYAPRLDPAAGVAEGNRALCGDISCVQDSDQESVVLFGNKWICLHCFVVEGDVWKCESCGRLTAGECEWPVCLACYHAEDQEGWPSTSGGVM